MPKHKVLLVDDERMVLNSLVRTLRDNAYEIITADSAEAAAPIVKKQNIGLIICDYKLGGRNGIDFLTEVGRDDPGIITILLTGHADLKMVLDAINRASLYKFIIKPWDNDDLRITVMRALEQRDLLMENKRLLKEIKKRDLALEQIEKEHPGITRVRKSASGRIILDDSCGKG